MQVSITITAEVSDSEVVASIITMLDNTLPYMCDNVVVTSDVKE